MASTKSIEVSYSAYSTLILHCSKYPSSEILGFLLGTSSSSKVVIERSIAVQHHWNRLSPMVEVAASLAEAHAASQSPPLQLIGIYHAPSDVTNRSQLSPAAVKVAQTFARKTNSDAIVLQVNNTQLDLASSHALVGFTVSANASTSSLSTKAVQLEEDTSIAQTRKAIASGAWKDVVDFDDHLEDTSLNWLEPTIFSQS